MEKRRILFFSETVSLAHAARPAVLAGSLAGYGYDVHLAWDPRYRHLFSLEGLTEHHITSISTQQFISALARGHPVYNVKTLSAYVEQDLELISVLEPDLVVGDFRLSLSISARLAGKPYMTITNAYWSPFACQQFPLPELPINRYAGLRLAGILFKLSRPLAFAYHARALNQARRLNGLPSLGADLRRTYTDADWTLYADIPGLIPTVVLPPTHHYLGPILWSPVVGLPEWWNDLPDDRPLIYVTLGSSGAGGALNATLEAIASLPVAAVVATAGRSEPDVSADNIWITDYLPGALASERAALVICNGGSPTSQQALSVGTPVIGIASNLDQHLNMQAVSLSGAGELLRSEEATAGLIRSSVMQMIRQPSYAHAARELSTRFAAYNACKRFRELLAKAIG